MTNPPVVHYNDEAERSVLGVLMFDEDGSSIDKAVSLGVKRSTFYSAGNGAIFDALVMLRSKQARADTVMVCQALQSTNELELAGGYVNVASLGAGGSTVKFESHVELLLCLECQRNAAKHIAEAGLVLAQAYTSREDLNEAIQPKLAWVQNSITSLEKVETFKSLVEQAIRDADDSIKNKGKTGIQIEWGIPDFDEKLMPMDMFELVVIGAPTSTGKSSMLRGIATHNIRRGLRGAIFQLESSNLEYVKGMAGGIAKVSPKMIHEETFEKQKAYAHALKWMLDIDSLKVYDDEMDLESIENRCRILKDAFKPHFVGIDHLHLIDTKSVSKSDNDLSKMTRITRRLIALQKYMKCTIIVLAQLNRESSKVDRQPRRFDLRGCGTIENDAHRIALLYRPVKDFMGQNQNDDLYRAYYDQQVIQDKMRNGPTGVINCKFASRWMSFHNL